jgi:SAM-dependent methyltransferase
MFLYRGDRVHCPCCDRTFQEFMPDVARGRENISCPSCGTHGRHRSLWLYLEQSGVLERSHSVLHFAPEEVLQERLTSDPSLTYTSADIASSAAAHHFDIEEIPFDDGMFDLVLCVHVLEHVRDDQRALDELFRVTRRGGTAIIGVPIDPSRSHTHEDPKILTPEERRREYWQEDHLRLYGTNFPDILGRVGFAVSSMDLPGWDPAFRRRNALEPWGMFVAVRPDSAKLKRD